MNDTPRTDADMIRTLERELFDERRILDAIWARINGEWDSPALATLGCLHADTLNDIKRLFAFRRAGNLKVRGE